MYSAFMAQNIGAVAPVPVVALPPPVQRPAEPAEPLRLGVPEGFLFLFVFDYLSTVQRKNPVGLIEAFKRAFAPGEGPQLLIKTINGPLRPLSEEEVLWAADGREDIHVVDRSLSGEELNGLMAACDCYVSLHRAEGFGLTIAEAMAIGKPAIATGYSGNVDFMNEREQLPRRLHDRPGRAGMRDLPAGGRMGRPERGARRAADARGLLRPRGGRAPRRASVPRTSHGSCRPRRPARRCARGCRSWRGSAGRGVVNGGPGGLSTRARRRGSEQLDPLIARAGRADPRTLAAGDHHQAAGRRAVAA